MYQNAFDGQGGQGVSKTGKQVSLVHDIHTIP